MLAPMVLLIVLTFGFAKLWVCVVNKEVQLKFGSIGPRKRINLADVRSAQAVRNHWYYGFGIRWIPGGWMWNISGLDAVELDYLDGRKFRIGTDQPEELADAITRDRLDMP
jgi:hypothetical protein